MGVGKKDIRIFHAGDRVEQSANDIWAAVCFAIRTAVSNAGINSAQVLGVGFDATCSLVVVKEDGSALPVGSGMIDAHAGGIETVGAKGADGTAETRMGYVIGTSACTMSSTAKPVFVPGVWRPYYSAMVPGLWLSEGGQSAAGSAIAHLLSSHPASAHASDLADAANLSLPDFLAAEASRRSGSLSQAITLAGQVIVVPDFTGNRSPLADPNRRAIILGLGFEQNSESHIELYVAGISGLGYGLRQIIEAQRAQGVRTKSIAEPGNPEPVLLGAAMLGAVSGGAFGAVHEAMTEMSRVREILVPVSEKLAERHNQRFKVFCDLLTAART